MGPAQIGGLVNVWLINECLWLAGQERVSVPTLQAPASSMVVNFVSLVFILPFSIDVLLYP